MDAWTLILGSSVAGPVQGTVISKEPGPLGFNADPAGGALDAVICLGFAIHSLILG